MGAIILEKNRARQRRQKFFMLLRPLKQQRFIARQAFRAG